jgi:signal transduction histidine kinase
LAVSLLAVLIITLVYFFNKKKQADAKIESQKLIVSSILETEEKERSRIAKDLHDGIVQDLTAIKLDIKSMVQQAPENIQTQLNRVLDNVDVTSKEVREISYQMMPVTLRELGLLKAIQELLNRSLNKNNIQFDLNTFGIEERLSEKIETTVYRICQELINNTIKHSQANSVSLLLQLKNNILQLTYEDDGVGFNSTTVKKALA